MTAQALLSGRGLARHYRLGAEDVPALRGVDIDIFKSDFVALQGPSGSGKSTLINLLGLLDSPNNGELTLNGEDTGMLSENAKSDIRRSHFGFVFQTFNLLPVLSAAENVAYPMTLAGRTREAAIHRAHELLAAVGLTRKAAVRPDLLSGGQRQRVAIARALANEPEVIFADEPTANLDTHTTDVILQLMQQLNQDRGVAFVFATHDARVVARAKRVLELQDGVVV